MTCRANIPVEFYAFWDEAIEKENKTRETWNQTYGRELEQCGKLVSPCYKRYADLYVVHRLTIESEKRIDPRISEVYGPSKEIDEIKANRKKCHGVTGTIETPVTTFRPLNYEETMLLYSGISHDCEGRYQYLRRRKQYKPFEKYKLPPTTNCRYGWKFSQES